jgi:predicted nucleic acid-binding protein
MVIVDTTVWIDFFGGVANSESSWLRDNLGLHPPGLLDLILCEVLQGIRDDFTFARVRRELLSLNVFDSGGAQIAVAAARNYRALRGRGCTVRKTIDCLIATFCIETGFELIHRDRDFDAFEKHLGLRVLHP